MIYFIKAENRVKIGFSENLTNRFSQLQTSSAIRLRMLLLIDGDYKTESELHKKFSAYKTHGEWFTLSEEIINFISDNKDGDRRYEFGFMGTTFNSNEQLKRLRNENRLSLKALGEKTNMTKQGVFNAEMSEMAGTISLNSLRKFANTLGCKLEYRFVDKFANRDMQ